LKTYIPTIPKDSLLRIWPNLHHRLCASASPVLTATDWLCQWERAIFNPLQNQHPSTDHQKNCHSDYVGDPYSYAKLSAHMSTEGFLAHG